MAGRCFFAVWPDDGVRRALAAWMADIRAPASARPVREENLHITLAFLGELDEPGRVAVRSAAAAIRWSPAHLVLDRIGFWQRNRVIWAGSREGSPALSELAEALRADLRRLGFKVEGRPFVPHVTLYRKARQRPRWRRQAVDWRISELRLMESTLTAAGAQYREIDRWSAQGDME